MEKMDEDFIYLFAYLFIYLFIYIDMYMYIYICIYDFEAAKLEIPLGTLQ